MTGRMHDDELDVDEDLVRRLLAGRFPEWTDLTVERVDPSGTDNAIFRLGEELVVRLPRIHWAADQAQKEHRWLPVLAPRLPLEVPEPVAMGEPADGYPWRWSVCRWLRGEDATIERLADPRLAAADLGRFVAALAAIDPAGGPAPGEHISGRGEPLSARDDAVRSALAELHGLVDVGAATAAWDAALAVPPWEGPPVWVHGDLQSGNLLHREGRLTGVIDFGCLGVGDPATDVMPAWSYLPADARDAFRAELPFDDDATWARGRGWALSFGLIALSYYRETNAVLASIAQSAIDGALAD